MRIVAGSVFATEVLLAIAPHGRIAGVHVLAADPRYSLVVAEVGDLPLVGAEPEQLLAVRPDLVILDAFTRPETQALLASARVPVLGIAAPNDFEGIAANILRVGRACHLEEPAQALVAKMMARLRELGEARTDLGLWRVCSLDGDMHTHGGGSLFAAMVGAIGARCLAADRGAGPFRKLSLESVLAWRPDALVVVADADRPRGSPAWLAQLPGFDLLTCMQKHRVAAVPEAMLGTTSHRLVDTAALLQKTLQAWGRP